MINGSIFNTAGFVSIEKVGTWVECYGARQPGKFYAVKDPGRPTTFMECLAAPNTPLVPIAGSHTAINYTTQSSVAGFFTNTSTSATPVKIATLSDIIIPAGMMSGICTLSPAFSFVSNGITVTANFDFRFGPTGTGSDLNIGTVNNAAFVGAVTTFFNTSVILRSIAYGVLGVKLTSPTGGSTWAEISFNPEVDNILTAWSRSSSVSGAGIGIQNVFASRQT